MGLRAALIAAITAFGFTLPQTGASTTNGYNIIVFGENEVPWADYRIDLDGLDNASLPKGAALGESGVTYTFNISGGKIWSHGDDHVISVPDTWTASAITTMNTDMGTSLATTDLNGLHYIASAAGGSTTTFILNGSAGVGDAKISNGDTLTLYIGITGTYDKAPANFNITGLEDATVMYATADADFSSTPQFTADAKTLTLLQVTGTVSDSTAISMYPTNVNNEKTGLAFVAYHSVKGVSTDYIWGATGTSANWSDAVWKLGSATGQTIPDNAVAIFDNTATAKTVNFTSSVTAKRITVSDNYTFSMAAGSGLNATRLTIDAGQTLTVSGSGTVEVGTLENIGTLNLADADTRMTVSSNISIASGSSFATTGEGTLAVNTFAVSGGTVTIDSNIEIVGGAPGTGANPRKQGLYITNGTSDVKLLGKLTNITGAMYANAGTVTVGDGTHAARVETNRIEFGDSQGGEVSTLNIMKDATVHVKGEDSTDFSTTGMLLGEWAASSVANIHGKLYGDNTTAYVGDLQATINIEDGGVMAVKGIGITANKGGKSQILIVNLNDGGKLVLGESGMTSEKPLAATFGNAEVGVSASSVEIGAAITLNGTIGTTFNTTMYTWTGSDDTLELVTGDVAGSLTVSGNITGDGALIKGGDGSLTLSGAANVLTHTIDLQKGELVLSGAFDVSALASGGGSTKYVEGEVEGNGFASHDALTAHVVDIADGATLSGGGIFTVDGAVGTLDTATGNATFGSGASYSIYYVNVAGSAEGLAHAIEAAGAQGEQVGEVRLANSTTLNLNSADAELPLLTVAADADAALNVTENTSITRATGAAEGHALTVNGTAGATLTIGTAGADSYAGAGDLVIGTGATVLLQGNNTNFTGNLVINGTLMIGPGSNANVGTNALGSDTLAETATRSITINSAGVLDLNGYPDTKYAYVLAGGKITNTGAEIPDSKAQMSGLKLTEDSAVESNTGHEFWLLSSGYAPNTLDLQGNTLVKTGDGQFGLRTTSVTAGTLEARAGIIHFNGSNTVADMLLTGGTFTGAVDVKDDITVTTRATADMSAALNIAEAGKVVTFDVDADQTHTQSGAVSGSGAIAKAGAGTLTLSAANTVTAVNLTQGTIKATAAGALGSGTTTVAAGTTLEMTVGNAVSGTGSVSNAGNVLIHNTLTAGTIAGGVLTLADDFAVTGDLEDVGGLTDTGNGFSLGGVLRVYDTATANLTNITSIVHGSDTYQLTDLVNGAISKGGANWTVYQLNQENDSQPTIQQIMDYATGKGATLASIAVNGDLLYLVDDSTAFKASMLSGTDEHLQMFSLMLDDGAELGMDANLAGGLYLSTDTESHATINLEKDVTVGMGLEAYNEGSTSNLTIDGAHTLSTPYFGVESGTATLQGGAHLVVTEADSFGIYIGDTLTVKGTSELSIPNTGIKSVDGTKDAVLTNDSSEDAYDIADSGFTLADAELTVSFADGHELGNVLSGTVAVVNAGAGTLTDVNPVNLAYDSLHAQGGNIVLQGRGENVAVRDLTVDAGRSVSMTDTTAGIVVSGTATFGTGSTVSSALTMSAGSTLDAAGPVALGSHALSLAGGIEISDTLWSTLTALAPQASTNIFTGVSALTLAGAEYSGKVDLSNIFTHDGLKAKRFNLTYKDGNVIVTKELENNRYWKSGSGTWNYSEEKWTDEDGSGSDVPFVSGYNAHFTVNGGGGTITVGEAVNVASVNISGAAYSFVNGDRLAIANGIDVSDSGTATFDKLANSELPSIGIGSGSSMTVSSGGVTVKNLSNAGTLTVTAGNLTITKATAMGGNVTAANLTLASGESTFATVKVSGTVSGATSIKVGGTSNIGTLSGVSKLTLTDGTLNLGAATGLTETSLSGALTTGEASLGTVTMAAGSSISSDKAVSASSISVSGGTANILGSTKLQTTAVTGSGTLKVNSGSSVGIASGSTMAVSGTLDMQAGSTLGNQGTLNVSGKVIAGNGINLGTVNATGTVEVNGAAVSAAGGSIATLDIGAGETLTVTNDLALTSTAGTAGTLNVGGGLTVGGTASLTNVTAGTLELTTAGTLSASGTLDAGSITLDRVSKTGAYLTAGTLSDTTTAFVVDKQLIWDLNASTGQVITLAYVDSAYAGAADLSINGVKSISDKNRHTYTIMQDATSHDIILKVEDQESGFVWTGNEDTLWSHDGNWSNLTVPGEDDWVQVKGDTHTIELDDEPTVAYFTVSAQSATLQGDHTLEVGNTLEVNMNSMLTVGDGEGSTKIETPTATINGTLVVQPGSTVQADATTMAGGTLNVNDGTYTAETIDMTEGAALRASEGSNVTTGQLNNDDGSAIVGGRVTITGTGSRYTGGYDHAFINVAEDADATLYAGEGLTLGGNGTVALQYAGQQDIDGVEADSLHLILNNPEYDNGSTLTLENESTLESGTIEFGMSAVKRSAYISPATAPHIVDGDLILGDDAWVVVNQDRDTDKGKVMQVGNLGETRNLVLAHIGSDATDTDNVLLNGDLYYKYYKNARIVDGELTVDLNDTYYQTVSGATSHNGRAGAGMLDDALVELNPQAYEDTMNGDLAAVMSALDRGAYTAGEADRILAAMSGASAAAMGAAWNRDVDRQLRAIRNRTTSMGVGECEVNEEMPYVNAWINAEGDYSKFNSDGTFAGYKLSSWGGTFGVDVDCTNRFTMGLAVTAMNGDFTAQADDNAEGDLDRMYVTVFGRYNHHAWTHTFVGTIGMADTKLERTVNYGAGTYAAKSDSHGAAYGLMYELGYTAALTEDASTCLQPVLNLSFRHSDIDGSTEKGGSDAALHLGDAKANVFTAALGARLQSAIGTSVYNRASLFEGRVMFKLDAGDRATSMENSFSGVSARRNVKSSELGAFGLEIGAGVVIPIAENGGSLFFDVTGEFRSKYTEVNGTAGYRYNF